jgi:hypothetical protein
VVELLSFPARHSVDLVGNSLLHACGHVCFSPRYVYFFKKLLQLLPRPRAFKFGNGFFMSTDISAMKEQFIDNTKVGLFVMEFVAFI